MRGFWQMVCPNNATVVVVGDIDPARARAHRERVRRLAAGGVRPQQVPRRRRCRGARCTIDKPGAAQSVIIIGRIGAALEPRLLRAPGHEHDPGPAVHVPVEPEPARDARLQLRRLLVVRVPASAGAVHGGRSSSDGGHGCRAARILQRARGHPPADPGRGGGAGEELPRDALSRAVPVGGGNRCRGGQRAAL